MRSTPTATCGGRTRSSTASTSRRSWTRRRRLRRLRRPDRAPRPRSRDLGVTCLWLMPFYPTPDRDDGYDITDYLRRRPAARRCSATSSTLVRDGARPRAAGDRRPRGQPHLRRAPLVPLGARRHARRPYRDFYVWTRRAARHPEDVVFPDQETGPGHTTTRPAQWYLHRFCRSQPDLNIANPAVRDEIVKIDGLLARRSASRGSGSTRCRSSSRPRSASPERSTTTRTR